MENFEKLCTRTESTLLPLQFPYHLNDNRVLHAAIGLCTETGELLDPLKKHLFYGREVDEINLKEEIGDILWYLGILCDALGTTIAAEQARVIRKLTARYPERFTTTNAIERDLAAEREVLEK